MRERTDFWKNKKKNVTQEVTDEVNQQPVYVALSALQAGKLPDGREVPGLISGLKLSRDAIVALRGEEFLKTLIVLFLEARRGTPSERRAPPTRVFGPLRRPWYERLVGVRQGASCL